MTSQLYITATDLKLWAEQRVAQSEMPRLIRSLIHATICPPERIEFPADESVQMGGWDGILLTSDRSIYVPEGLSVWEIGTNKDIKGKADDDYEKRVQNPLGLDPKTTTFIFVTPRIWGNKEEWIKARRAEGIWKEVRAYDADDLEQWLSLAPAVRIWFSQFVGKTPENMTDFETFWQGWIHQTRPAVTPELVLAGRTETVAQLKAWLTGEASAKALQGESREEALAVFLAMLQQLPEEEQDRYFARGAIVYDPVAWKSLASRSEPMLLVPYFDPVEGIGLATRQGHQVLVPQDRVTSLRSNLLEIPRVNRDAAQKALQEMEIPEGQARTDALIARKSLMALRRKLANGATFQRPLWAKPEYAQQIIPAMFAGEWHDSNEEDRAVLERLSGLSYQMLSTQFTRWKDEADAPVRRIGQIWLVTSKQDSWGLLTQSLTPDDLKRFQEVVLQLLGTVDPRKSMEVTERLLFDLAGNPQPPSDLLRTGLVDTLALMASRNDKFADGSTGQEWATKIVRQLLQKTKTETLLWSNLASILPLLAEAAPEVFLEVVKEALNLEVSALNQTLTKSMGADPFSGTRLHVPLLWALEGLAWNPNYLRSVSLILAKLIHLNLDEKSNSGNRPEGSLRDIFLCWMPNTSASLEQRLKVIDVLRQQESSVAWDLMLGSLPEAHGMGMNTSQPRWRDWAEGRQTPLTYPELWRATSAISERLLQDLGQEGDRWCNLLERLHDLPDDNAEQFVQSLLVLDLDSLTLSDRTLLRDTLGKFIDHHRDFDTADWAMPAETVNLLEKAYHRLTPDDLLTQSTHLFASTPYLLESFGDDWRAKEEAIAQKRLEAVRAIYQQGQLTGLLEFVLTLEQPGQCGYIVGKSQLLTDEEIWSRINRISLDLSTPTRQFSDSLIRGLIEQRGEVWVESILSHPVYLSWSATHRAEFYLCLGFDEWTWKRLDSEPEAVKKHYWSKAGDYGFNLTKQALEKATPNLLLAGRPYEVIFLLGQYRHDRLPVRSALVEEALEMALQTSPPEALHVSMFSHHVRELMNGLETAGEIENDKMARLEWGYQPFLKHQRTPKLLHELMGKDPAFFLEILSFMYTSNKEERTSLPTPEEKDRAHRAYQLLESWRRIPGSREDGSIDFPTLKSWTEQVRELAIEAGMLSSVDGQVGHLFAHSPQDEDGVWPKSAVRNLLELIDSEEMSRGFMIQVYNNRGVVSKQHLEGGKQERLLSDKYSKDAVATLDQWPYVSSLLSKIADGYDYEARHADLQSELEEDLH